MKHFSTLTKLASTLCLAAFALNSQATLIIDQNQMDASVYMAAFSQSDLAQSFQQSNGNIAGAGIFLQANQGSTGLVNLSIWDALPTNGGTQLAGGSAMGTQGEWLDVFWNPVATSANDTLFLLFDSNDSLGVSGSTANPYAFGSTYANSGYGNFPSFDYTFRTYYDDGGIAQVSEPGTLALLGLGLIGVAAVRRKK